MQRGRHWSVRGPRDQAAIEIGEMEQIATQGKRGVAYKDPLLSRRYVIPFLLACVILICNTATGINTPSLDTTWTFSSRVG